MLISDYTNYNNKSLLEAESRIKERWRKNKINCRFKKKDKILIFGTLNYSKAILDLGSNSIFAVDNCQKRRRQRAFYDKFLIEKKLTDTILAIAEK